MNKGTILHPLALVGIIAAVTPAIGDTITTKAGETIRGTVRQFRANHHATASSAFVVEVDGEDQAIPLHKIETITFESRPQASAPAAASSAGSTGRSPARQSVASPSGSDKSEAAAGTHWLTTSSGKRHNEKCRYYKTSKGRPCGPGEGSPCKVCGG